MKQEEMNWKSNVGHQLFATVWQPETDAVAVVTLVHGFGEHCLRYTPYVTEFVNEKIAFVAFDLYGHGQSDGKRGTMISYKSMLDDVELALNQAALLFPGKPIFLYGHSMGGNLALNYLLTRKTVIAGGIISSPWLTLFKEPNFLLKGLVSFFQRIIPNVTIDSGLEIKYISSIDAEVEKYRTDPLNHGRISFRMFHEITQNGIWAMNHTAKLNLPVLMLHGINDKITSIEASTTAAEGNQEKIEFVTWENGFHELHNDTMRKELAVKVIQWIKGKI